MQRRSSRAPSTIGFVLVSLALAACSGSSGSPGRNTPPPSSAGGSGGSTGAGGSGGSTGTGGYGAGGAPGTGGSTTGGSGGSATGGSGGSGGGKNDGGAPTKTDGGPAPDGGGGGGPIGPSAPGQGPTAEGKIVFSQDFEKGMDGMQRSPGSLPVDRIQIVDDPVMARGKVARIHYEAGDNFRTSPGTEPRSWFSSAAGYTIKSGSTVSIAFGFMFQEVGFSAHFAQVIRDGGPLWMFGNNNGGMSAEVHRGSGGGNAGMKLQPMKWYDFRIELDYKAGGTMTFFINGQQIASGKGDGGADARFDCGIYWNHGAKSSQTVYLSNLSIGEK